MLNDTRKLTVHTLDRLALNETVSYQGEPCEVLSLLKYKNRWIVINGKRRKQAKAVTLKPVDGGKTFTVTRPHLEERAGLLAEAQKSLRKSLRSFRESHEFIFVAGGAHV